MDLIRPLGEVPFLLTVIAAFLFFWGMFLPFNFIILQAERYGMSAQLAAYLVPILNAARYASPLELRRFFAKADSHMILF
jgi:hypothetical protein